MIYKIGISGSYGRMNLGDEAILEGILQELRSCPDIEIVVFSFPKGLVVFSKRYPAAATSSLCSEVLQRA